MPRGQLIQIRRGSAADWSDENPVLAEGEIGFEFGVDGGAGKVKFGDGTTAWVDLPYVGGSQSSLVGDPDVSITTPDNEDGDAGTIVLEGGDAPDDTGGSIELRPGSGDTAGVVRVYTAGGDLVLTISNAGNLVGAPGSQLSIDGIIVGPGGPLTFFCAVGHDFDVTTELGAAILTMKDSGPDPQIGFFSATANPVGQQNVPLTTPSVQDVIDALVALGLVEQSD